MEQTLNRFLDAQVNELEMPTSIQARERETNVVQKAFKKNDMNKGEGEHPARLAMGSCVKRR